MVDREIEETLDLVGMEVACHHPVGAGRTEEVGGELGSDGDARTVLAVLACPSEVRDDGDDLVCGGALGRVDTEQELHQVLRRREGRLDEEYGGSPDAFHVGGLELSVTERGDLEVAEPEFRFLRALGRVQSFDHFGCKVPGGPAGKDCHTMYVVHISYCDWLKHCLCNPVSLPCPCRWRMNSGMKEGAPPSPAAATPRPGQSAPQARWDPACRTSCR